MKKIPLVIQYLCPKCEFMTVEISVEKNVRRFRCINPDCGHVFDIRY